MEEDEIVVEEPVVEGQETLEEEVDYSKVPWFEKPEAEWTTDDVLEAKKAIKTASAQKTHWKNKFEKAGQGQLNKKPEINKTNKNESLSTDDVISLATIVASGVHPDVLKEARDLAKFKGISVTEALKLPTIVAYATELKETERKEKAQLGASGGNPVYKDFKKPLTAKEHRELWEKSKK